MSQLGKLYKYYFRKIFCRNWLRIMLIALVVVIGWWFGLPYMLYKGNKYVISEELKEERKQGWNSDEAENQIKQWTFRSWSKALFGQETEIKVGNVTFKPPSWEKKWKLNRETLAEKIEELKEIKKAKHKETKKIEKLEKEISYREALDRSLLTSKHFSFDSPWKADIAFFFCQTEGYRSEKPFLKLLNDISWWNLTGSIALFWLFFKILDNLFFKPQNNGEESTILNLVPGVKRSDLWWSKTLAFLTFYFIMNVLLFLLPFGFYYWWTGINTSFVWFSLLALWTTLVGPILFFSLIFIPYLFLKAKVNWLGWIISALLSFSPVAWFWIKCMAPSQTWLWSVENWFFDPVWFIPISLITGIVFFALLLWNYEKQDLK